jgi:hypothetical protein
LSETTKLKLSDKMVCIDFSDENRISLPSAFELKIDEIHNTFNLLFGNESLVRGSFDYWEEFNQYYAFSRYQYDETAYEKSERLNISTTYIEKISLGIPIKISIQRVNNAEV